MGFFQSAGSFLGRMVREDSHCKCWDAQCRSFVSACFGQRCRCFAGGEIACEKVFLCYGLQVFIWFLVFVIGSCDVLAVFVIRWTSSFVQRLQFPLVLVKIFASFFCYKASGVSFMFGIKRLLTCLFRISSVLCLCWVRSRYRRGRMPSWLGLEQVAVSVRLISLFLFIQYWVMFMLQVFVLRNDWFWFTLSCVWTVFTGALLILQDC